MYAVAMTSADTNKVATVPLTLRILLNLCPLKIEIQNKEESVHNA
jgi:hypothetical protein